MTEIEAARQAFFAASETLNPCESATAMVPLKQSPAAVLSTVVTFGDGIYSNSSLSYLGLHT